MSLKELIQRNLYFFVPYLAFLIILPFPLILESRVSVQSFINQHHSLVSDYFFKYITSLGGGLFVVIISVLFLLVSFRKSLFIFLTFASGGLFVQILKRVFFPGALRPVEFLDGVYELYLIEGVRIRYFFGFPSGHAATAFGLFLCLAILAKSKPVKLIFFIMAALVSFSRVYLSQHFLIDIYFGSMIGVALTLLFYRMLFSSGKKWLDQSIWHYLKSGNHAKQ